MYGGVNENNEHKQFEFPNSSYLKLDYEEYDNTSASHQHVETVVCQTWMAHKWLIVITRANDFD